ncbi:MAG: Slp family lipoprotein [Nitrospinales bacterium]
MKNIKAALIIILFSCTGCVSAISDQLRSELDASITFPQLLKSPEASIGKKVMLGGTIVRTNNYDKETEVEVVQKELDSSDYPITSDYSGGRFIFVYKGFLEPEIYAEKRKVTGAGTIIGSRQGKVGEKSYTFPVIEVQELKLWEKENQFYSYYDPYYYGAFGYSYGYGFGHPYYSNRFPYGPRFRFYGNRYIR